MWKQIVLLVGICLPFWAKASLTGSLSLNEQQKVAERLQKLPINDLETIYYITTSLNAIEKNIPDVEKFCKNALNKVVEDNIVSLFQFSHVVNILKCKGVPKINPVRLLKDDTDSLAASQIITAAVNLGNKVDDESVNRFVKMVKENDTPKSAAAAFYAASLLPSSDKLKPIIAMVEDIIAQADLVGGETLQFEGGLSVTSSVVRGIVLLADAHHKSSFFKQDQVMKFAQYFLNRKFVHSLKDTHSLLVALQAFSQNKHQIPAVITVFGSSLISNDNKFLKVRPTNLLDKSILNAKLSVKTFSTADETVVLFENKPITLAVDEENIVIESEVARGYVKPNSYKFDVMSYSPVRGMYNCKVNIHLPKDKKQYAVANFYNIKVKVLAKIMVEDVEVAVGEKDRELTKGKSLSYPGKLSSPLEADYHQKIVMTFNLKDVYTKELVTAHQTFMRLLHEKTGQEIFFVAEADGSDHYKFTLDVGGTAKDSFNNLSGKYLMSLIVGDATMQVPINWPIGDVHLKFAGEPKKTKRQERITEPKPVIEHMFRVPEKRPSKVVSTAFTALVLSPLLVMFGMWAKVGVNLSNFTFSPATLLFHVGLAAIFVLYYLFWIQLDMFQTLKLLAVVGGLTFLAGNKMLADMAASKYRGS